MKSNDEMLSDYENTEQLAARAEAQIPFAAAAMGITEEVLRARLASMTYAVFAEPPAPDSYFDHGRRVETGRDLTADEMEALRRREIITVWEHGAPRSRILMDGGGTIRERGLDVEPTVAARFIGEWNWISVAVHENARAKGFRPSAVIDQPRRNAERLCLIHSEISEALEAIRAGNPPDEKVPAFSAAEVELADAVIRIMDCGVENGWNIAGAVLAKIKFNRTRPQLHGGKLF